MEKTMETLRLDAMGDKCPLPVQKIAAKAKAVPEGSILEVVADCPNFESDVRKWCDRTGRIILSVMEGEGTTKTIQIQF